MAPQEESKIVEEAPSPQPPSESAADAGAGDEASSSPSRAEAKSESGKGKGKSEDSAPAANNISQSTVQDLLKNNPALATETQGMDSKNIAQLFKGLDISDLITGMSAGGKNKKDMASYKFWSTQPVSRFDEPDAVASDGPVREMKLEDVPKEGSKMLEGFEWVTMDLNNPAELKEVYELLTGHYVEDKEAMFRFNYSFSFLEWALKAPGWTPDWHVGVRVTATRRLVAFISGIPISLKVRENTLQASDVNYLCIHKKLRGKRLAPVLIKEITRRCNLKGVWQAMYTGGVLLPKPVSTCRYFHRALDWLKLYDVGFSPLHPGATKARQVSKYNLPGQTNSAGLREMKKEDIAQVQDLLTRYLSRFDLAQQFSTEEMEHWFLHKSSADGERVIWAYVVEDPHTHKITDFFSFYALESSVIGNKKHSVVRGAYLFYYASEAAFNTSSNPKDVLKKRLNALINDALIIAKREKFDVFNALTSLDSTLFLEQQKFGAGDGQLHFYLFNWRTPNVRGGIDELNRLDEKNGSGVGMVML